DEGWRQYEWRWQATHLKRYDTPKPLWQGEAAVGRILLIQSEQGFGDTLQFCRYASLAAAKGLRVVLEVQPALVRLMKSLSGIERVIPMGQPLPDFDFYCPTMSLPTAFNTRVETIPSDVPYLFAAPEAVNSWKNRLPESSKKMLKVGLVWAGSSRTNSIELVSVDHRRSINPELLAPLMDVDGIQFFSLQKLGPSAPKEFGLVDMTAECRDFADTAALIANLDLVISVDTAVAHLAGALGKPVWILNRFDSCWRWMETREDSPWYPTLRLFRQPYPGDWSSVVLRVRHELKKLSASKFAN
ncbi:MAG: glycosyltransferase family 9 protein, partial [Smithella sp.]